MNPLHPQTVRAHQKLLAELFALERSGNFDHALSRLRGIWDDTTHTPDVGRLDTRTAGETYLRCGALIGFLGHIRQIPTAQERSRNLLTGARSVFLEIHEPVKIAECENYLALAYWRTGEINEAATWVEEALTHRLPAACDARLYSHVIRHLIFLSQKRFVDIHSNFAELEDLFLRNADNFLLGNFYMNFGLASRNLGEIDTALNALETSRQFFEASGNKIQVAMAENNLSFLHKFVGRFDRAHLAIDNAMRLFQELKDRTREGFALDTKALIYFEEGDFLAALETVERAIELLGKSENFGYLTETILTKAKIQLYLNDFSTATLTLLEAVELAKLNIGEEAAANLVRAFESTLRKRDSLAALPKKVPTGLASGQLKLVMPPSIAHYDQYHGVWINNSDLEPQGLSRGSLAVVVPCSVKRGDLVALIEDENDLVSCGFYDSDFGIICLETGSSEPQLFNQSDVTILGRIVGVCDTAGSSEETMQVRALES